MTKGPTPLFDYLLDWLRAFERVNGYRLPAVRVPAKWFWAMMDEGYESGMFLGGESLTILWAVPPRTRHGETRVCPRRREPTGTR